MEDPEFIQYVKRIGEQYAKMIRTNADRLPPLFAEALPRLIEVYSVDLDEAVLVAVMTLSAELQHSRSRPRKLDQESGS